MINQLMTPFTWVMLGSLIAMLFLAIPEFIKHKKVEREEHEESQKFVDDWLLSLDTEELRVFGLKRVVKEREANNG